VKHYQDEGCNHLQESQCDGKNEKRDEHHEAESSAFLPGFVVAPPFSDAFEVSAFQRVDNVNVGIWVHASFEIEQ
jgi:hypothetical protein